MQYVKLKNDDVDNKVFNSLIFKLIIDWTKEYKR